MGNWTKFLINKKGEVVLRLEPHESPSNLDKEIGDLLAI
jgi:glutathione peroxidase-family protein